MSDLKPIEPQYFEIIESELKRLHEILKIAGPTSGNWASERIERIQNAVLMPFSPFVTISDSGVKLTDLSAGKILKP